VSSDALRVLIVDDEPLAREGVRGLLEREGGVEVVGECADGQAALDALDASPVDVIFLDIEMPGMNGFDVAEQMTGERPPVVVFVTAHDDLALRAFEASALDYIVKPFTDARFSAAVTRARQRVQERRRGAATESIADLVAQLRGSTGRWADRIAVRSVGRVAYVRVKDIAWIGSADYYAELHTTDGKSHLVRESMQKLEGMLDPSRFARAHRTAIVSLDHVVEIRSDGTDRAYVILRGGVKLPLGKARRAEFESALAHQGGSP
jgi:two-component system LytT family response regulator